MEYLKKEYKIENYDIKADKVIKQNYTDVLSLRKHLDVRIGTKVLNTPTKSLLKIFSLCSQVPEEWVLFLFEVLESRPVITSYSKNVYLDEPIIDNTNVIEAVEKSNKKYQIDGWNHNCLLCILFFIIGSILIFHILGFVLSDQVSFIVFISFSFASVSI